MNGLREKFRNKKGFTLIEMLIVVAIIAILIAISIPLINGALEKSRDATDQANERAAKAEALLWYMEVDATNKFTYDATAGTATMLYDAAKGTLVATTATPKLTAYGKCTGCDSDDYPNSDEDHTDKVIQVTVTKDTGAVEIEWVTP